MKSPMGLLVKFEFPRKDPMTGLLPLLNYCVPSFYVNTDRADTFLRNKFRHEDKYSNTGAD